MKHTIIICDLCGGRIFKENGYLSNLEEGALRITARQLKLVDDAFDKKVVYAQWKRKKYHICRKCVGKLQGICNGRASNENA